MLIALMRSELALSRMRQSRALALRATLCLALAGCAGSDQTGTPLPEGAAWFFGMTNFAGWVRSHGQNAGDEILTSPEISCPFAFDELIVSWNAESPADCGLKIEARAIHPSHATVYYVLGWWAGDSGQIRRESVVGQKDEDGDVATDTLILRREAVRVQIRITLITGRS